MLEIKRTAISLEERELLELEVIITDGDRDASLRFLKKSVYDKLLVAQRGHLKSHLDGESDAVEKFKNSKQSP